MREQQQLLRQQEQLQQLQRWQPVTTLEPPDAGPGDPRPAAHCWAITDVRLTGNHTLSQDQLAPTLRTLSRPCMTVADLERLLRAVTLRYVQAGYPTSRPYLARAPRDHAPLDIVVIEGFVETLELAAADLPLSLSGAFAGMLGKALYLPDLEQGLDQLNRLRAYELGIELLPGEQPGGTRVVLTPYRVTSRWHLDARLDNHGSALTGRHRLSLGLGLDSPLGLNDELRLSILASGVATPGQSMGASLHYSLPHGPWSFSLNASQMRYRAPVPQTRLTSSGHSEVFAFGSERMLWRNQHSLLSASARLERKQLLSRIGQAVIAQQSPTLTSVETGLNLLWLEHGLWNFYLGVSRGTDWLGADRPTPGTRTPRPDFTKYRANLLHLRQGPVHLPWRWQSELTLQHSRELLPAVEQLQLTAPASVRGFRQHSVAGADAAVWRNTLSQPLARRWSLPLEIRPMVGLDLGWARFARDSPSQRLAGATAGIELSLPQSRLRLDYQRALHASDLPHKRLEEGFWAMEWTLAI
nr:ShlB/FhaC/HecB family hemolysin secretion/activation protein [Pseudomonas muyukensis]